MSEGMSELYGAPVVIYDGTNAEAIVAAMHLEEGDAVVEIDAEKTILLRASQLDMMRADAFSAFTRKHFPPARRKPTASHNGLLRRLLEGDR
jgi:hypothetical protein